ncbi:hypothetical protein OCU04_007566 [Sclerotinia nivalis]|uniref:Uncharacterized protein n=1 Tax=Sclerotinia nivalis TaxID=352851 RepID=A0A9X0AJ19_9HELO|nr:hypothetical protein OCU04_007566 [Sclerotinia nivalis]
MISSFMDSPKRKRNNLQPPTPPDSSPMRLELETSMTFPTITPDEASQGSPRTKVAYHFQGLALDGPTDIKKLDLKKKGRETTNAESAVRKRVKMFASKDVDMTGSTVMEIPETPQTKTFKAAIGDERKVDPIIREMGNNIRLHNELDPIIFRAGLSGKEGRDGLARPYPSINRLPDSKSRKKRMGTPPLSRYDDAMEGKGEVLDPDRVSLTWHDDEITGHKPDDPDDDGEGINGIGFRPTPAIAYARTERRKQQMADYRSREAREARARRSERRRGTEAAAREKANNVARRVRFLESDTQTIISTS